MNACEPPDGALLNRYRNKSTDHDTEPYVDCYSLQVDSTVSLQAFVYSFYTTPIFKLERLILRLLVAKPSSDSEALQVADGTRETFAAWKVEDRTVDQLLMCDFRERTRSWFMVKPITSSAEPGTTLYFGSAVIPVANKRTRKTELGQGVRLLLGFHKLYSKILLQAAASRF